MSTRTVTFKSFRLNQTLNVCLKGMILLRMVQWSNLFLSERLIFKSLLWICHLRTESLNYISELSQLCHLDSDLLWYNNRLFYVGTTNSLFLKKIMTTIIFHILFLKKKTGLKTCQGFSDFIKDIHWFHFDSILIYKMLTLWLLYLLWAIPSSTHNINNMK